MIPITTTPVSLLGVGVGVRNMFWWYFKWWYFSHGFLHSCDPPVNPNRLIRGIRVIRVITPIAQTSGPTIVYIPALIIYIYIYTYIYTGPTLCAAATARVATLRKQFNPQCYVKHTKKIPGWFFKIGKNTLWFDFRLIRSTHSLPTRSIWVNTNPNHPNNPNNPNNVSKQCGLSRPEGGYKMKCTKCTKYMKYMKCMTTATHTHI